MENMEKVWNLILEFKALKRYGIWLTYMFGSGNLILALEK